MSRRRKSQLRLSFFAFQDIITAVTGVVLVIVLMLALELHPDVDAAMTAAADSAPTIVRTADEIEQLEKELKALREEAAAVADALQQSAALSEADREKAIAQANAIRERLEATELELRADAVFAELAASEADRERDAAVADQNERAADARARAGETLAQLQAANETLQRTLESVPAPSPPKFVFPDGVIRDGRVVLFSGRGIEVGRIGMEEATLRFESLNQFQTWEQSQPEMYLLLVCKPSGTDAFETFKSKLEQSDRPFGYELVVESAEPLRAARDGQLPGGIQ